MPYLPAELQDEELRKKLEEEAAVWLTDDPQRARRLLAEGESCLYLLTPENRGELGSGIEWCAEVPEDWRVQLLEAECCGLPAWLPEDFLWRVWLRSRSLPWHICETERLALREMTEADLDFLYELQKDEEAARFLEGPDSDRSIERQKLIAYRKQMYGFYGFGIWIVIEKERGRVVGRAGLQMRDGFEDPELGFAILKEYRQKGYAQEACRAVLSYARQELELKTVRAVVDGENTRSQRLCEKLGFSVDNAAELEGRLCIFYSCRAAEEKDRQNSPEG